MATLGDVVANPNLMPEFLMCNVLIASNLNKRFSAMTPVLFNVEPAPHPAMHARAINLDGSQEVGLVYSLSNVPMGQVGGANPLVAYQCDYQDNRTLSAFVGDQANLMFTAKMDGCTLAVGRAGDGRIAVSHSNDQAANDGTAIAAQLTAQGRRQKAALADLWGNDLRGNGVTLLNSAQKRIADDRNKVTAVGVRGERGWQFFYQTYRSLGGRRYQIVEFNIWADFTR